ncbi:MAG: Uma2 family endonuclease [Trebonia sp.]
MAAQGKRNPAWEEVPPEPVPIGGLRDLRDRIETGHHRAEVIDGELVVSPMPVIWHEKVCQWLVRSLDEVCEAHDWFLDTAGEIDLPPTGDLVEPDLMILRDAGTLPDFESLRPLDRVLLAGEVISASSIRRDREVKPRACALAGIPLYLLVDRFTKPVTISLHSEPGPNGYAKVKTVIAGEKLRLPAPFGRTLDTSSLPLPG